MSLNQSNFLTEKDSTGENPYLPYEANTHKLIEMLETITPVDKALAVPYALIWEIDPKTLKPIHTIDGKTPSYPLSVVTVEPPKFGATLNDGVRFRERPPVSLEKISIKKTVPNGYVVYTMLTLGFTVHRPEIVFEPHVKENGTHTGDRDSFSSMVTPGQAFALEYGWRGNGTKNKILNGEGIHEGGKTIAGSRRINFVVTDYTFNILGNMELKFNINAIDLGQNGLRSILLVDPDDYSDDEIQLYPKSLGESLKSFRKDVDDYEKSLEKKQVKKESKKKLSEKNKEAKGTPMQALPWNPYFSNAILLMIDKLKNLVGADKVSKTESQGNIMVPYGVLFDEIFVPSIERALKGQGFIFKNVFVGNFNENAGKPADKYSTSDMSGKPISEFTIPLGDILSIFSRLYDAGDQITLYNFLQPFIELPGKLEVWDKKADGDKVTVTPHIMTKTVTVTNKDGEVEAYFYIFDKQRETARFTAKERDQISSLETRSEVRKFVSERMPYVSFDRANSFIEDANFEVIQDDNMKQVYINKYFGDQHVSRKDAVEKPSIDGKKDRGSPAQSIFAPVIRGTLTMIGNFAFDNLASFYLDFGVPKWNGVFTSSDIEDIIEPGKFTTRVTMHATPV